MRVGVEVGGTFTDLIAVDAKGTIVHTAKVFSTPSDPSGGVLEALSALPPDDRDDAPVLHGSTVATNAVLERRGPVVGFLVTHGFRDILELQRQDREHIYDLHYQKPKPLVSPEYVREVPERLDARGQVVRPLDEESVHNVVDDLISRGVTALAICLLHSYLNPAHERRIREIIRERDPALTVSLSSEVMPEFREYERASTTTVDAFVRPVIDRYLGRLEAAIEELGLASLWMMQSNGGLLPASSIRRHPVQTLFSGPAAGVTGALAVARAKHLEHIITMDMGGTSTDVCLVANGEPEITTDSTINRLPIRMPMLDIVSVGAGGGSIAWLDSGGMLHIGPESAGAEPGPACYGLGGTRPTTTDANVVRGLIRPDHFLGGRLALDRAAAERALRPLARDLGQDPSMLAESIFRISTTTMAAAMRLVSVERGHDPRDFVLLTYGGAGPLYAASVADELNMRTVVVPPHPGLISAWGLLVGRVQRDFMRTSVGALDALTPREIRSVFDGLREQALLDMQASINVGDMQLVYGLDMRYRGQGFELTVPVTLDDLHGDDLAHLAHRFDHLHQLRYGHARQGKPAEVVTYRLRVVVPHDRPADLRLPQIDWQEPEMVPVVIGGAQVPCQFFWRPALPCGFTAHGPVVIEEETSTTFVPPGWTITVDTHTNLVIERSVR